MTASECGEPFPFDSTNAMLCEKAEDHSGDHKFTDTSGTYYWRFVPPKEAEP